MIGMKAPRPRAFERCSASYEQMTEALAWAIFQKKQAIKRGAFIGNMAGYYLTLLKAIVHSGKPAKAWSEARLLALMGSDARPDQFGQSA